MGLEAEVSQADQVDAWLREGIAAVKAGQNERACELLIRVVALDEQNAQAWLWLSGVVESLEDRQVCLENVLKVDPDNAAARKGLAWVHKQIQQAGVQAASPAGSVSPFTVSPVVAPTETDPPRAAISEPPVVQRTRTPVTPAAALLREDFASRQALPEPAASLDALASQDSLPASPTTVALDDLSRDASPVEPAPSPFPIQDEFSNEYSCPYCAAGTEPDDNRCRSCGKDLWVRFRKQEKRSTLLWILLALQLSNVVWSLVPALLLAYFGSSFVGALFGISEVPPLVLYLMALPSLFSAALAVGLYFRLKPAYYLLFVDAAFGVVTAALALISADIFMGGANLVLAVGRFALILQVGGDFEWDRRRILLRTDRGLKSSVEYLTRADFYNGRKMWALAVVHLRAALALLPDRLNCYLALAVAYIRLKRCDLAERALVQARGINPGEPRIAQLEALVKEMRVESPALL
jgi:tetratricopeptide (TPR) repeat protein